ncbi:hypothetical protein [Bifidobacterium longum]|jgi:hypothetical protein|uniref:hypothetical protein n=1 Tax=Bifidobacterium longum TaxID=216816 RepID=UPI000A6D2672|nr:hypothetical protein [Bifidobacterium longum]
MDELLKHLQNQWLELMKDMDPLASDQDGFRDVDSESLQLMSVRLVLLGWHKSKDSDKD